MKDIDFSLRPDQALVNDGEADHLPGMTVPKVVLPSMFGGHVDLSQTSVTRTVVSCYPVIGVPGKPEAEEWDGLPGARAFQEHYGEFLALDAEIFLLSTQTPDYLHELANRLCLPFEILSDAKFELGNALSLPTFEVDGMRLLKRLTLVIKAGRIEHVLRPGFPPDESADQVLRWLTGHPPSVLAQREMEKQSSRLV